MRVCVLTRQVCVAVVLGSDLEGGQQQLLSGGQEEAVCDGGVEGGGHVTDEADQGLHASLVGLSLGLRQRGVQLLQDLLQVHLPDQRLCMGKRPTRTAFENSTKKPNDMRADSLIMMVEA